MLPQFRASTVALLAVCLPAIARPVGAQPSPAWVYGKAAVVVFQPMDSVPAALPLVQAPGVVPPHESAGAMGARLEATLSALAQLPAVIFPAVSPTFGARIPSGFGLTQGMVSFGLGMQGRTRYHHHPDGALSVNVGLGDPRTLGFDAGVVLLDLRPRDGEGGFAQRGSFKVKVHHQTRRVSVAAGLENVLVWGGSDAPASAYVAASYATDVIADEDGFAGAMILTAGLGTGRFLLERDLVDDRGTIGLFAGAAFRVSESLSAFAEWTGQDLAFGGSFVPLRSVPFAVTFALDDLTGLAGDGARPLVAMNYMISLQEFFTRR